MDWVLRTSVISVGHAWHRLAAIAERLAAQVKAIVAAVGNVVPSAHETASIQALERQRDRQKAFGTFWLGERGFFG